MADEGTINDDDRPDSSFPLITSVSMALGAEADWPITDYLIMDIHWSMHGVSPDPSWSFVPFKCLKCTR